MVGVSRDMKKSKFNHPPPFFVIENGGGREGVGIGAGRGNPLFISEIGGLYYLSDFAILV